MLRARSQSCWNLQTYKIREKKTQQHQAAYSYSQHQVIYNVVVVVVVFVGSSDDDN